MNKDPTFSFDLHPSLDAELDAAFERNVVGDAATEDIASKGLVAAISQVGDVDGGPLENNVLSEQFKAQLNETQEATRELFSPYYDVPNFLDAEFKNTDWKKLEKAFEAMQGVDMQPEIIAFPQDFGFAGDLYNAINTGLDFKESDFTATWWRLDKASKYSGWLVNVISGTQKPAFLNFPHKCSRNKLQWKLSTSVREAIGLTMRLKSDDIEDIYPDIRAYLTFQALRRKNGKELVDGTSSTWLKHPYGLRSIGSFAAYGQWNPDDFDVMLRVKSSRRYKDPHIGIRPTVTG